MAEGALGGLQSNITLFLKGHFSAVIAYLTLSDVL
jgi:hypothetical protein